MKLASILLYIDELPGYDKDDVDKGNTPEMIYKICSSMRECFCISYYIRKDNDFYIFIENELTLIKLHGKILRFMGSDERSQAILLRKALDKVKQASHLDTDKWLNSTPGIFGRKFEDITSMAIFLKSFKSSQMTFLLGKITPINLPFLAHSFDLPKRIKIRDLKNLAEGLYIIPINERSKAKLIKFLFSLIQMFPTMLDFITLSRLSRIKAVEEKILYINYQIDQQGLISKT